MALAKLPKCFDLIELRKGYFPHFFNTLENQNYYGYMVILEVIEALKFGYKIVKIYEIWHFPLREKYNKSDKPGGLFIEYVNTFLRIKLESSGTSLGGYRRG
jgi:hypothetical protein